MKEILIGVAASLFFAVTFILNRSMELAGGSWIWSSSLRFFFMVPLLLVVVMMRRNVKQVIQELMKNPVPWLVWSFTGFVLFYAPLTFAAAYGPGWLVAGTWQITIIAGILIGPFFFEKIDNEYFRKKIPLKALTYSSLILIGVILIQLEKANHLTMKTLVVSVLPVAVAAFCYPLGNRKMMELCGDRLDSFQRVLGMTLATIPFWILLAAYGLIEVGPPSNDQIVQSFIVALCSGVIATTLFFIATNRVRDNQGKLAAVEATQSTQVLFVLIGELLLLSSPLPNIISTTGLFIIIIGMVLHSFNSREIKVKKSPTLPLKSSL